MSGREQEIIDLASKAKNSAKFLRLFRDGNTEGYKGLSEADGGLVKLLAFRGRTHPDGERA